MISVLNNISTIIFDLGGVIINIDINRSVRAFAGHTNLSHKEIYTKFEEGSWSRDLEKGDIGPDTFRQEVRRSLNSDLNDEQVDRAWNAMLVDVPISRLELLAKLRDKYQTLVLSNTNAIHLAAFNKIISSTTQGGVINDYFDQVYYSHELGMRKPDIEIFSHIIDAHELVPQETLFIDDMAINIMGAKSVGLKTLHLTDQEYLAELFSR